MAPRDRSRDPPEDAWLHDLPRLSIRLPRERGPHPGCRVLRDKGSGRSGAQSTSAPTVIFGSGSKTTHFSAFTATRQLHDWLEEPEFTHNPGKVTATPCGRAPGDRQARERPYTRELCAVDGTDPELVQNMTNDPDAAACVTAPRG